MISVYACDLLTHKIPMADESRMPKEWKPMKNEDAGPGHWFVDIPWFEGQSFLQINILSKHGDFVVFAESDPTNQ